MPRALFVALFVLALFGNARVFLYVVNHLVFGGHREAKSRYHWMLYAVPPLLLALLLLFRTRAGAAWMLITAVIGTYWILDRLRVLLQRDQPVAGTRTLPSEIANLLEVTRHEVAIDDLPPAFDGYRIAFLTDTHVASFIDPALYREAVAQTMRFEPDLILLGGDFVTWERDIPLIGERLLAGLDARDGVHAVLGNHDYWANPKEVVDAMTECGVRFVINSSVILGRGEDRIALAGIDEIYRGTPDLKAAFAGLSPDMPCITLSHHPDIVETLAGRRVDLLVCGHTHGGQIRFPFFGAVVVPSRHEARYASGFHRAGGVLMYVSRGVGAIPPIRILCKPEVATFVLRRT